MAAIDGETGALKFKLDKAHGQHNPTWLPNGNVLIFDNGHAASRVVEVDPASGETVWSFRGRPRTSSSAGTSPAPRALSSGNVLVCEGTSGRLFEVTRAGRWCGSGSIRS